MTNDIKLESFYTADQIKEQRDNVQRGRITVANYSGDTETLKNLIRNK